MRTDMMECIVQFNFPVDTPDLNGNIYTKEAVKNAFEDIKDKKLPLLFHSNDDESKVIGTINSVDEINFDEKRKRYSANVKCKIFFGGSECNITEFNEDGSIKSFYFTALGFSD